MKTNSTGSVMPTMMEVNAAVSISPATWVRFSARASCTMAKAAAGRAKSLVTKSPPVKKPAVGSPAMKRATSPVTSWPAVVT